MNQNQDSVEFSNQSSIKISKTSTGKASWEVKVYDNDAGKMISMLDEYIEIARQRAKRIEENG